MILESNKIDLKEHEFETEEFNPTGSLEEKKVKVLKIFKDYLESQSVYLMKKFKKHDKDNKGNSFILHLDDTKSKNINLIFEGWLSIYKWAEIISEHVSMQHPYINPKFIIYLKDNLCPCDESDDTANYAKMITPLQSNSVLLEFLENAFNLIDLDQNGFITQTEARDAIKLVNKSMGTNYDESYISKMDLNGDGVVDFKEFSKEFTKAYNLKSIK